VTRRDNIDSIKPHAQRISSDSGRADRDRDSSKTATPSPPIAVLAMFKLSNNGTRRHSCGTAASPTVFPATRSSATVTMTEKGWCNTPCTHLIHQQNECSNFPAAQIPMVQHNPCPGHSLADTVAVLQIKKPRVQRTVIITQANLAIPARSNEIKLRRCASAVDRIIAPADAKPESVLSKVRKP
jgi:hypothetical protein